MTIEENMQEEGDARRNDPRWEDLRKRAERVVARRATRPAEAATEVDSVGGLAEAEGLIHELEVHGVELELQNEVLLQTGEELRDIRDRYLELYEFAPVGYVTLDTQGQIQEANLTFTGMLQRERVRLEGKLFRLLVHADDRSAFDGLLALCRKGERANHEVRLLRSDETPVWTLLRADPHSYTDAVAREIRLTATDIADRKKAEDALLRSEERLRLVVTGASLGIWDLDLPEDDAVWNDKLYELLGRDPSRSAGSEVFFSYVHKDDLARVREHFEEVLDGGTEFNDEFRIVREDGEIRWLAASSRVYRDRERNAERVAGVCYDITDRKNLQQALSNANRNLERRVAERTKESSRRARQLRRLAFELSRAEDRERSHIAGLLHEDLQQLLVSLKLQLQALRPGSFTNGQAAATVPRLQEMVGECIRKTSALSYELSPPALERLGLIPVLEWLATDMQRKHGLDVRVDADPEAEPPGGRDVASLLYRSMRELLLNIVKHADAESATIVAKRNGDEISITVKDEGRGLDLAEAEARRDDGGGFGLFSIEERVSSLGGELEIESAPGHGCTVTMRLPAGVGSQPSRTSPPPFPGIRDVPAPAPPEDGQDREEHLINILIADDHDLVRQGLVSLLEDHEDFKVVAQAASGNDAVHLALTRDPDVVLMDVSMPGMNGIAATEEIKKVMPHIHVIGLSMHDDPGTRAQMLESGASDYLTKAGADWRLLAAIRGCLAND